MTQQEVIQAFMQSLANHGYSNSDSLAGTHMLDGAIRASSRYSSASDAITAMKAEQQAAEREAIQYVLGDKYDSKFDGKQLSEITSSLPSMTWDEVKDKTNTSQGYYLATSGTSVSLADIIRENTAKIFLKKYCGLEIDTPYWVKNNGETAYSSYKAEADTGAITGKDAGGSTAKTNQSVVPEIFANTYKAAENADAQTIVTNERNWVIQATDNADTITSNGADSINAGAGNDQITANANYATITTGAGKDTVTVAADVTDITFNDLNSSDTLKINGDFEVASAEIDEDGLLVVTGKNGRIIRFDDYDNALNAKVNSQTVRK